jgi:hypothetical protein
VKVDGHGAEVVPADAASCCFRRWITDELNVKVRRLSWFRGPGDGSCLDMVYKVDRLLMNEHCDSYQWKTSAGYTLLVQMENCNQEHETLEIALFQTSNIKNKKMSILLYTGKFVLSKVVYRNSIFIIERLQLQ